MFSFRLTFGTLVLWAVCLQCRTVEERDVRHFHTWYDNVDGRDGSGGGGGGPWVSQRAQWTLEAKVDEDDAGASLRESVVQAVKHSRSRMQGHAIRSRSPENLVTSTQFVFLDVAHLYLPAVTNVSQVCRRDLTALYLALAQLDTLIKNGTLWPLKLVDSWGKFSDGLLAGNFQQLGFFKECLDIKVYQPPQTTDQTFHPLNHPPQPLSQPPQRQNVFPQPLNALSQTRNFFSKAQNADSYLPEDQQNPTHTSPRPQPLPSLVYKALNLAQRFLRVPSQPSPDPQGPPRHHPHDRKALNLPGHPHESPQDESSRRYTDLRDGSTTTTTSSSPFPLADFSGQYCLVIYTHNKESEEFAKDNVRTPVLSAVVSSAVSNMAYSTCIPSTCTQEELQVSVQEALLQEGLQVAQLYCQVKGRRPPLGAAEVTGIVIVSVLVALMLLGALADLLTSAPARQHFRQGPLKYLLAFSVTTNLQKMFHLETRKLPGVIPSINGIRFISITWVVLGHQYAYTVNLSENLAELSELSKPTLAQIILNGDKSVDTFLMLSGLLVTLGLLGMVNRLGRFNLPLYLFHRLLRLWPPVALTSMLVATLASLVVSGPLFGQYWNSVVMGCRHRWWSDVTFINNLMFPYIDQLPKEEGEAACCLPHTWYLGVDTQLYLLMPLLLLPLIKWPRKGWVWLLLWNIASVIIPGAIIGAYDLWPTTLFVQDLPASLAFTRKVYSMPWCRAGPYLVGAWAGYLLYHSKSNPAITLLKPWQVCLGWMAAVGVALAVLLGIAPYNFVGTISQVPEMSTAEAVLYGGVHRAAWGMAVAWVIVACTWGYGGPVAWILEHPIWQPFSRLSYCIYLTSLPLQFMILHSAKRPTYYTLYSKLQETAGVVVVTVVVSVFVSLASESPTLRLEKILLSRSPEEARPPASPSEVTTPPRQETDQGPENGHVSNSYGKE